MTTQTIVTNFELIECCVCGVLFFVPAGFYRNLSETKQSFYCPMGHGQSFTKSTTETLKEHVESKDKLIVYLRRLNDEATETVRRLTEKKRAKKKKA